MANQTNSTPAIVAVPFQADTLIAIQREDGIYVAIRPICERLGVQWSGQLQRIKRHPILAGAVCVTNTPFTRHGQEETCLKLDFLNGWLMGVNANRVKPEVRDDLIAYQRECHQVLFEYFYRKTSSRPAGPLAMRATSEQIERQLRINEWKAATNALDSIRRAAGNRTAALAAPDIFAKLGIRIDLNASDTLAQGELPLAETAETVH